MAILRNKPTDFVLFDVGNIAVFKGASRKGELFGPRIDHNNAIHEGADVKPPE